MHLPFIPDRAIRTILGTGWTYFFGRRGKRRVHALRLLYRMRIEMVLRVRKLEQFVSRMEVKIWVDGKDSYKRSLKLIAKAKHTIIIQIFIWKNDETGRRVAAALLQAADRGVHIDITKEATGDVFELGENFGATQSSDQNIWKRFWSHRNIQIHHIQQDDHAKVMIIDGRTLLLTGMNIADEYAQEWRDFLIELRGHRFVDQYLTGVNSQNFTQSAQLILNTHSEKNIRPTVMKLLQNARQTIVLVQAYLSDTEVLDLLVQKSKEGVRIIIILPEKPDVHQNANMQSLSMLLSQGNKKLFKVFISPRMIHGKVILTDRHNLFIGSANLVTNSLDQMGEANVLLTGKWERSFRKIREAIRSMILESKPLRETPSLGWMEKVKAMVGL